MPKDAWAKARAKDTARRATRRDRSPQKRRRHIPQEGPGDWNQNTVLWFGKHRNKPIKDVPRKYLVWLSCQIWRGWRMQNLRTWLRKTYLPATRPQDSSPGVDNIAPVGQAASSRRTTTACEVDESGTIRGVEPAGDPAENSMAPR